MNESPFAGIDGVVKNTSDFVIAFFTLILLSPLMLCIALAVKFTSPGPVIFKQRRYGLNGEEIIVYKFRSMTVVEDGADIVQAKKNDQRVTKIGAFLRRTSLDELPQFVNVLQGRMSIVGPRPHAVAHNELYRKLIKGYMLRHKAKPGITGWAQVNGWRGEAEVLEKMKARIEHIYTTSKTGPSGSTSGSSFVLFGSSYVEIMLIKTSFRKLLQKLASYWS